MSFKTILVTTILFIVALLTLLPTSAQLELPKNKVISSINTLESKDEEIELPGTCQGNCPLIANPTTAIGASSKSEETTNMILGIARIFTFIAIPISLFLTPIALIVSLILQFIVKKHAKWAWITTGCLFGLFFVAIIGYLIVGLFAASTMGDLTSSFVK